MPAEEAMRITRPLATSPFLAGALVLALAAAGCGDDTPSTGPDEPMATSITVVTHDSFAVSDDVLAAFTAETGIDVEILSGGDAGQVVAEAVLTAGSPLGDVLFGIDNTFLQRGLDAEIFEPYESAGLADVPDEFELDDQHRVTPIDFGDVCVNYWIDGLPGAAPTSLDDLLDPINADQLVVESPETSSPGLAFLLATIAEYGDGWEDYWAGLRDNGVTVTAGWEDAYYSEFMAGGGSRSLVVSYASSPAAEVVFATEPIDAPPTGVMTESCYRQIEFAGVLRGTDAPAAARAFIDFMLTPTFQNDVPLSMFVFPVSTAATLPPVFVDHVELTEDPHILDPAEVETDRDLWTDRWVEIVLR
jgi:thiamine transport system substrate-binding protein